MHNLNVYKFGKSNKNIRYIDTSKKEHNIKHLIYFALREAEFFVPEMSVVRDEIIIYAKKLEKVNLKGYNLESLGKALFFLIARRYQVPIFLKDLEGKELIRHLKFLVKHFPELRNFQLDPFIALNRIAYSIGFSPFQIRISEFIAQNIVLPRNPKLQMALILILTDGLYGGKKKQKILEEVGWKGNIRKYLNRIRARYKIYFRGKKLIIKDKRENRRFEIY